MDHDVNDRWDRNTIDQLVQRMDPEYFKSKRWFGSKGRTITGFRVAEFGLLQSELVLWCFLVVEVSYAEASPEQYQLPLALGRAEDVPDAIKNQPYGVAFVLATSQGDLLAYDAFAEDTFCADVYRGMYGDREVLLPGGELLSRHVPGGITRGDVGAIRRIGTEQSNSSVVYDDSLILKAYRKLLPGLNPDFEVPHFLTTRTEFNYVPKVAGFIEYRPAGGDVVSLDMLQEYIVNQGDGYTNALNWVREYLESVLTFLNEQQTYSPSEQTAHAERWTVVARERVRRLGAITGMMHVALASRDEPADFRPEPITRADVEAWEVAIDGSIRQVIQKAHANESSPPLGHAELLPLIGENEPSFLGMVAGLDVLLSEACFKIRCHGDFHLGQVLQTGDDFVVLDFEGEPARSFAERRAKRSPLRDVAGLLRSFDYAAYGTLFEFWQLRQSDRREQGVLEDWVLLWTDLARAAFIAGYREEIQHSARRLAPVDITAFQRVVRVFEVEKAFYELEYEFNNRPAWVQIPARGLLRMLHAEA